MATILGDLTYNNDEFKGFINSYYSEKNMKDSVAKLKAAKDDIDIRTMEYGEYQPILMPLDKWPKETGKTWRKNVANARYSLKKQKSAEGTKWDTLNNAIRRCFNAEPPIPMEIDVEARQYDDPAKAEHDIRLEWIPDGGVPTLLKFTMICPHGSTFIPPR